MENTYLLTEDGEELIIVTFSKGKPVSLVTWTFKELFDYGSDEV
jgi:hypothetical protein